jgi:cytochrome c peroxidase
MASNVWIRWISRIALGVAAAAAFGCASPPGEVVPCSPQDTNGVLCAQVARGETDFHNGALPGLGGNGRACSDCHMDSDSFQLSPTDVETRFQAMSTSGVDDPLFRSIDADDFDTNGDAATDYSNLRQNGLIRVRLPLPANFKLVDPSSCSTDGVAAPCDTAITYALSPATTTDVWRSVPSVFDVKLTGYEAQTPAWPRGPDPQGGYQLDGRADTLQKQALGAFQHHAQVTTDPDEATLDDVAAYEETLLAAPEPALNDLETQGKTIFKRACAQCHDGPGMASPSPDGTPRLFGLHDVETTCPPPVDTASPPRWSFDPCPTTLAKNERTYEISFADGYKMRRTTSDPGRALLTGFVVSANLAPDDPACLHQPCGFPFTDDWQKFEISPLHGISKTAPYFHNNSAATLEDVVIHYEELYKQLLAFGTPSPPVPPIFSTDGVHADRPNVESERAALVAYLMKL